MHFDHFSFSGQKMYKLKKKKAINKIFLIWMGFIAKENSETLEGPTTVT